MTETAAASPATVLVVEDERALAQVVVSYLERAGYDAHQVHTGPAGLAAARDRDPDLVILDLGLPGLDGIEVCREIRTFSDCYIIMLTARDDEIDKLLGLGVGADDYVTKPFSPRELVARAQAALRRPRASKAPPSTTPPTGSGRTELRFDGLTVDLDAREVHVDDVPAPLTRTEFDLLAALARQPRRVFSRRQLVDAVWGEGWVGDEHIVDVHIAHVRRKIGDDPAATRYVDTVRGIGYRFALEPQP